MRVLNQALRYVALCSLFFLLTSCKKPPVMVVPINNHPTINLFGFEESQLHHIHNTVELHRNIFLVRFDPEQPGNLEWVNCPISATYKYQESRGRRVESMYISSYQDLQAKVPVNYARFAGQVKNGKAIEFNYVTIGSYELLSDFKIPENDPDCARATHYVVTLSVGAFNFSESQQTEGKIGVEEKTTGVGVEAKAGRAAGEATSVGDLESCMDDQAALHGCFTPLQLMMMPLANRHWSSEAVEEEQQQQQQGEQQGYARSSENHDTQETVSNDLTLQIDQETWQPGYFMANALQQILLMATRIDVTSDFAFDDQGTSVFAGYIEPSKPQYTTRSFEAGKTYAIIGASATGSDVNIKVGTTEGNVIAEDVAEDGNPVVTFTPPESGTYAIEMSVTDVDAEFGAMVVMVDGGVRIPPDMLQFAFQRLLDTGSMFAGQALEKFNAGLVFHEDDWSVQGTVLYPGETITQRGISLAGQPAVFTAVSHEESYNIDIGVTDANTGQQWVDTEPDSNPLVFVQEPQADSSYEFAVGFPEGTGDATLATSLLLRFQQ